MRSRRKLSVLLTIFAVNIILVQCQVDGSFWWQNKDLIQKASESRQSKRVDFKEDAETTTVSKSDFEDGDCTCVHKCRCQVVAADIHGTPSACGAPDHVCCHIIKLPIPRICVEIERNLTLSSSTTTRPSAKILATSTTSTTPRPLTTEAVPPLDNFVYPNDDQLPKYSFLLQLYRRDRRKAPSRICGAALINKRTAITAQHCVRGSKIAPDFMIKTSDNQIRIISQIIRHPDYYSGGLYNDLAILKWEDAIRITDEVDVIDLPSGNGSSLYSNCRLVAFQANQSNQDRLAEVQETAELLNETQCEQRIRSKWGPRFQLHESFMCIETDRPAFCSPAQEKLNRDGCPLVCYELSSEHPVLLGIISWYSCNKEHPDVLSRAMLQWISEVQDSF